MSKNSSVEMVITELRGDGEGVLESPPQVFKFSGREHSSSMNDLELHLKVTTVRKEMPGSNTVVEQAMSATWQPFELNGEWDDKWGNRRPLGIASMNRTGSYAFFMFQEFSKLVSRMPLVRLELDALSFVGLLTDLTVTYRTKTRIGWKVTISPHENETVEVDRPAGVVKQSIPKWLEDSALISRDMNLAFDEIRISSSLKTSMFEKFQLRLLEVNDALSRLEEVSLDAFIVENLQQRLYLMATTYRRVRNAYKALTDDLISINSAELAFEDSLQAASFSEWVHSSLVSAWRAIGLSMNAEDDVRKRAYQKPKAIYYPKRGESLERISMRFYGSANNWRAIYDKNNLSSLVLDGNEELLIPEQA